MKSSSRIRYVEGVPVEHRFETRQCSEPIAFNLSNGTKQQEDKHKRHGLKMNLDKTEVMWVWETER